MPPFRSAVLAMMIGACAQPAPTSAIQPPASVAPLGPPTELAAWKLSPLYVKHVMVTGFPVLGSASASDAALREVAYLIERPAAGRARSPRGWRRHVPSPFGTSSREARSRSSSARGNGNEGRGGPGYAVFSSLLDLRDRSRR